MTLTARRPHDWLTVGTGLVAALIWTSLGVRALVTDNEPSARALFACAAMTLVGVALGSATWVLAASRRATRLADATQPVETRGPSAMLGIMLIGLGASSILDPSPSAWGWVSLVAASVGGGLNLGVAFMGSVDRSAASGPLRPASVDPLSGG